MKFLIVRDRKRTKGKQNSNRTAVQQNLQDRLCRFNYSCGQEIVTLGLFFCLLVIIMSVCSLDLN